MTNVRIPCKWQFDMDDTVYDGFWSGTLWNGYPVIWVDHATRDLVDPDGQDDELECDESGLASYEGMTTSIVSIADTESAYNDLSRIYNEWLTANNLPHECAEEVIHTETLNQNQRWWLGSFIDAWEIAVRCEADNAAEARSKRCPPPVQIGRATPRLARAIARLAHSAASAQQILSSYRNPDPLVDPNLLARNISVTMIRAAIRQRHNTKKEALNP